MEAQLLYTPVRSSRPPATFGVGGLIVDIADVLYDATLWRRWLVRLVNQLGVPARYSTFYRAWDAGYLVDVNCGRREYGEAFESFLLASQLTWAQVDEVEAASRAQSESFELTLRPWPGVVKTIHQLGERGLPMVALADDCRGADAVTQRLARLGLRHRFSRVLSSFDLECAQPAAGCYQAALDALGLAADQVAYLGHDAEHLAGAQRAGLRTVAFNFQRDAPADVHLTSFEDLPSALSTLSDPPPRS